MSTRTLVREAIRQLKIDDGDVLLVKKGTPLARHDVLTQFAEAYEKLGRGGLVAMVVDDFSDVERMSEKQVLALMAKVLDNKTAKEEPGRQELVSSQTSRVWSVDGWVYKRQMKFLTENEFWAFQQMNPSGYVPAVERMEAELIRTKFIERQPVTDPAAFMAHYALVLKAMLKAGLRHGDLTEYAVIPSDNRPYIVDWAESRLMEDPRPDKRSGGDAVWLLKTMRQLAGVPA